MREPDHSPYCDTGALEPFHGLGHRIGFNANRGHAVAGRQDASGLQICISERGMQ